MVYDSMSKEEENGNLEQQPLPQPEVFSSFISCFSRLCVTRNFIQPNFEIKYFENNCDSIEILNILLIDSLELQEQFLIIVLHVLMKMANFLEGDITDLLPLDIWIEIISELPTSSVMSCKCVCKSWRLLIEGCKFVATLDDLKDKIFEALTLVTEFKELDSFVINYRFCPLAYMETWELCMDKIYLDLWQLQNFKPKQLEIVPRDGWVEFVMYKTKRIENLKNKIEKRQMLIRKIKEMEIFMDECAKDFEIDTLKNQEIDRLKAELRSAISDAWINLTPIH